MGEAKRRRAAGSARAAPRTGTGTGNPDGRPYLRGDAYALLLYVSADGSERERVWNSRDGETPYVITLRSGRAAMHAGWSAMVPRPDYVPPPGSRVFVDLTEGIAARNAEAQANTIWDNGGAEGMYARNRYQTVADMIEALTEPVRHGAPALIEVPEEGWTS